MTMTASPYFLYRIFQRSQLELQRGRTGCEVRLTLLMSFCLAAVGFSALGMSFRDWDQNWGLDLRSLQCCTCSSKNCCSRQKVNNPFYQFQNFIPCLYKSGLILDLLLRLPLPLVRKVRVVAVRVPKFVVDPGHLLASQINCEQGVDSAKKETEQSEPDEHHQGPFVDHQLSQLSIRVAEHKQSSGLPCDQAHCQRETHIQGHVVFYVGETDAVVDELTVMVELDCATIATQTVLGPL